MNTANASIKGLSLTPEQQKAVQFIAEFTKRMVLFAFPGQKTPARAMGLIKEIYRVTDDMITGCFENGTKPPCKKGCFWCCFLRVKTTPLEVLCILDYLHTYLGSGEISDVRQRLATTDKTTRGMDGYQRVCLKITCPLLMDGECMVYPVRPIACRVYHSLDLSDCHALLDELGNRMMVRQDISGMSMGLFAGLLEGLRAVNLQSRLLELTAGLRIAMDESGTGLVKTWLSGEPAFLEAEIAGAEKIENFHRTLIEELGEPLG